MHHVKACVLFVWIVFSLLFPYATLAQSKGICGRTPQIQSEILAILNQSECKGVTPAQLATISTINVEGRGISALAEGDFGGLTNLEKLLLGRNGLKELPENLFADLANVDSLSLEGNSLRDLPAGLFEGLTSLEFLRLGYNSLRDLPAGLFEGLTSLKTLSLTGNNDLASLP